MTVSQIERRIEAMEKTLKTRGGHSHIIIAKDEEDAERQISEIKKWDPKPKAFLVITDLYDKEELESENLS